MQVANGGDVVGGGPGCELVGGAQGGVEGVAAAGEEPGAEGVEGEVVGVGVDQRGEGVEGGGGGVGVLLDEPGGERDGELGGIVVCGEELEGAFGVVCGEVSGTLDAVPCGVVVEVERPELAGDGEACGQGPGGEVIEDVAAADGAVGAVRAITEPAGEVRRRGVGGFNGHDGAKSLEGLHPNTS